MKYHKFFAAPILAAALLMLSPTVALANVSGGQPPPTSGSCTQVGQTCTISGGAPAPLSAKEETTLLKELITDAQNRPSIALQLGELASQLGTISPSTWFSDIAHGITYEAPPSLASPNKAEYPQNFISAAEADLTPNSPIVGAIEEQFIQLGYVFTYTVGSNSPGVTSSGTSSSGPSSSSCNPGGIPIISWFSSAACTTGNILGFIGSVMADLLDPARIAPALYGFFSAILTLPFLSGSALGSWITFGQSGGTVLGLLYSVLMPFGFMVAVIAAAAKIVKEGRDRRGSFSGSMLGAGTSLVIGLAVIYRGESIGITLFQISNKVALDLVTALGSHPLPFNTNGQFDWLSVPLPMIGMLMMLIALIVVVAAFLWLLVKFLVRTFIVFFCIALLPIAVGFAVYDTRNEIFRMWLKHFTGALASASLAAIGIELTLGLSGAALASGAGGVSGALWQLMSIGFLVVGVSATAKIMSIGYGGVYGESGVLGMGMGMAAGVAGAVSLMGKGVALTKGVAKVHGAAGKAVAGGAMVGASAGASAVGGALAARSMAKAGHTPTGIYKHLPLAKASALGGSETELAAHSVLQNDPFSQQMLQTATGHLPADTTPEERLSVLSSNKEFRPLMQQWLDGTHMVDVVQKKVDPSQITTKFSSAQQKSMMNMAAEASQAHFRNQGGIVSVAKAVKPAASTARKAA